MTIHSSLVEHIGRRRLDQVWTRHGRRFCRFTSLMLVTTVDQPRRGTLVWPLRSSCDKHHARTTTRGTQGRFAARRLGLYDLCTYLRAYLADRAELGNLHPIGMVLATGRLLALFYEVSKTLLCSVHPPPAPILNVDEWDDVRM